MSQTGDVALEIALGHVLSERGITLREGVAGKVAGPDEEASIEAALETPRQRNRRLASSAAINELEDQPEGRLLMLW